MKAKKTRNIFVVRGLDMSTGVVQHCRGLMQDQPVFVESVATGALRATEIMLTDPIVSTMNVDRKTVVDDQSNLYRIDFTFKRNYTGINGRTLNSKVRDIMKSWAEKSRIRGTRGWRANAVSTALSGSNTYGPKTTKVSVLLSGSVHYDSDSAKHFTHATFAEATADMQQLVDQLVRELTGEFSEFFFVHSVYGKGELIG